MLSLSHLVEKAVQMRLSAHRFYTRMLDGRRTYTPTGREGHGGMFFKATNWWETNGSQDLWGFFMGIHLVRLWCQRCLSCPKLTGQTITPLSQSRPLKLEVGIATNYKMSYGMLCHFVLVILQNWIWNWHVDKSYMFRSILRGPKAFVPRLHWQQSDLRPHRTGRGLYRCLAGHQWQWHRHLLHGHERQ